MSNKDKESKEQKKAKELLTSKKPLKPGQELLKD